MGIVNRFLRRDHGEIIRRVMVEKMLTVYKVAAITGLTRQTVYDVLKGKAGDKALYTVIDTLGIDIHDLLKKREKKHDPIRKSS